jgi:hypothetical protein
MQARFSVSRDVSARCRALLTLIAAVLILSACAASPTERLEIAHAVTLRTPLTPDLERVAREAFYQEQELREYLEPFPPEAAEEDREIPLLYGAFVDLADDGNPAAVFYVGTPAFCGTAGCPLEIFRRQQGSWQHIADGQAGTEIIFVLVRKDNGLHRILVNAPTACVGDRFLQWDGRRYVDHDPCPPGMG